MREATDPPRWPCAVVFDLDGTLVDSAPDIQEALNAAFGPLGVPTFELRAVKTLIGGGAPAAVRRAAAMVGLALSSPDETRVLSRFYDVYVAASARGRGLYPGAHELLAALASRGVALALCTNKAEHVTAVALKALEIDRYFGAVVGALDDRPKKPSPEPVLLALRGLGATAGEAVMVGDTSADIGAAKAAGLRSIAIAHGYAKGPVEDLGADRVVGSLGEVDAALAEIGRLRRT
ncbi:MAG: HAD-IA family hydrolase [Hyphomicrobiaceae bacterium]|nr:HAD-IA family hydrolase [Hyphomicrobiaceae bacterium]